MRAYTADMIPGGASPVINVSQYDNDYAVTVTLIEGAEIYTPPSGATIMVEGTKPDSNGFSYACTYQGNVVTMPIYTQMTAVAGRFPIELVVYQSGLRVGSCNITLAVERAPLDSDEIISDSDIPAIIALAQAQADAAAASATAAASSAASAETAKTVAMDAAQDAIDAAQELQTAIQFNAALIHETASGAVASFADGADNIPMQSVVAEITPVQNLNGQANPYPPGGGKNKLPYPYKQTTKTENGVTFTDNGNGIISLSGTATAQTDFILETSATGVLPANTAVIVSGGYSNNIFVRCAIDGQTPTSRGSDASVTTTNGDFTGNCYIRVESGTNCNNVKVYPMIRLASVSDGTYAPYSNICPISGRTGFTVVRSGKNLYAPLTSGGRTNAGITWTYNADGTISATGTATGNSWSYGNDPKQTLLPGTYTASVSAPFGLVVQNFSDGGNLYNGADNTATFTISKETTVIIHARVASGTTVNNATTGIQLEVGTSATAYKPYTGTTIPITWESIAGTVYGGTLDVVSGVLTVEKGYAVYDGSEDESWEWQDGGTYKRVAIPLSDVYNPGGRVSVQSNAGTFRASGNDVGTIFASVTTLLYYPEASITSLADYKTWLASNNLQVVYPLATPQTYQITLTANEVRTLLGGNTIYTDAGDVSVEYIADTKLYIDNKIAELQALVLEN